MHALIQTFIHTLLYTLPYTYTLIRTLNKHPKPTQTVYKLEEELAKSVKSGKEQAAALAELEGKLGTLKQQLKAQEAANNSLRVQAATLEAELEQVGEKLRAEEAHGAESSTQLAHYTRLAGHLEERIAEEMERSGKLQEDLVEATQKLEEQLTQLEEQEQKMAVLEKARAAAVEVGVVGGVEGVWGCFSECVYGGVGMCVWVCF